MGLDERPFCRVFLNHRGPSEEIERLIAELIGANVTFEGIINDELEVLLDDGDSWPPIEERDYSRWIDWKYSLEVYPASDGVSEAQVAVPLRALLEKLNSVGVKAVPACSYEELLVPWNLVNVQ